MDRQKAFFAALAVVITAVCIIMCAKSGFLSNAERNRLHARDRCMYDPGFAIEDGQKMIRACDPSKVPSDRYEAALWENEWLEGGDVAKSCNSDTKSHATRTLASLAEAKYGKSGRGGAGLKTV
jgi:hypothetical protein